MGKGTGQGGSVARGGCFIEGRNEASDRIPGLEEYMVA